MTSPRPYVPDPGSSLVCACMLDRWPDTMPAAHVSCVALLYHSAHHRPHPSSAHAGCSHIARLETRWATALEATCMACACLMSPMWNVGTLTAVSKTTMAMAATSEMVAPANVASVKSLCSRCTGHLRSCEYQALQIACETPSYSGAWHMCWTTGWQKASVDHAAHQVFQMRAHRCIMPYKLTSRKADDPR